MASSVVNGVNVRVMNPGDRTAVVALNVERQDHERDRRPSRVAGAVMTESYLVDPERRVADADGEIVVAAIGERVGGFASWYWDEDPLEEQPEGLVIGDLVVTAEFRVSGVGRALIDYIRAVARRKTQRG